MLCRLWDYLYEIKLYKIYCQTPFKILASYIQLQVCKYYALLVHLNHQGIQINFLLAILAARLLQPVDYLQQIVV